MLYSLLRSPLWQRRFIVIGLVAVLLLVHSAVGVDPLLYSARDASTTGFHQDLSATGYDTRSDAALVLEEWAKSLNLTDAVIRDIRLKDFASAENDLQQCLLSEKKLDDLIDRLDMIDTDAATFQLENHATLLLLSELLNQTQEFEKLQDAEAEFRDQKNIPGLKSVEVRGEDLRAGMRRNIAKVADRSDRIVAISQKFGLDTSEYEQSMKDLAAVLKAIDAVQDARSASIAELIQTYQTASEITLQILPDHGAYGDTLSMEGTVSSLPGTEAIVFVDGLEAGRATVDNDGQFSLPYEIGRIESRNHTVYASIGSDLSDVRNFSVETRNTTISLSVKAVDEGSTMKCVGTGRLVTENGVPVRGARVSMNVEGRAIWESGMTGDDGAYTLTVEQLTPGVYTLTARFDPSGFPLKSSESAPVTVGGPSQLDWIAALVYFFAIGGAGIGGVLFLRDRQPTGSPSAVDPLGVSPAYLAEHSSVPTIEDASAIADQVTVTNKGAIVGDETIVRTYRRLVRELEAKNPDLRLRSRTPRDLAVLFADRPFGDQLGVLVAIHEKVRYAERDPTEDDLRRVREAFIDIITEGDGH